MPSSLKTKKMTFIEICIWFNIPHFEHFVGKHQQILFLFFFSNRITTLMGSRTLGLLLSTWTTPSVLVLLRLQLQARPRPQAPVPLLAQAHEHKKTGKALRRLPLPLPRPQPQHPPHLRNNLCSPFCCAWSLHRPALRLLILRQTELLVGPVGPSPPLSLAPRQGRARPPIIPLLLLYRPPLSPQSAHGMCSLLAWSCLTMEARGAAGDYRGEGTDKRTRVTRSWRCWSAYLNNEKVYIVCYCFWLFQSSSSRTLYGLLLGEVSDVMKNDGYYK